ncbi:hypothetical protein Scep_007887 [Stephania cephalantha]|uniref:Uncharacterized protein n=1 Tax=Stephania cephalantha TaxID=152367 RepID=A0AAP0KDD1_9MAGN
MRRGSGASAVAARAQGSSTVSQQWRIAPAAAFGAWRLSGAAGWRGGSGSDACERRRDVDRSDARFRLNRDDAMESSLDLLTQARHSYVWLMLERGRVAEGRLHTRLTRLALTLRDWLGGPRGLRPGGAQFYGK